MCLQIVREYLPSSVDLETLIKQANYRADELGEDVTQAQIPLHTRLFIAWQCALGLNALHSCGIAHGNLCQANILVQKLYQYEAFSTLILKQSATG